MQRRASSPAWGWRAAALRLAGALAISAAAHAFVLANTSFAPPVRHLAGAQPLDVRFAMAMASSPPERESAAPAARRAARTHSGVAGEAAAQASPALPAPEIYYKASELDERAIPLFSVDVEYPAAALAARMRGAVRLRLMIDHSGVLQKADIVSSTPAGVFDAAALKAVQALRFRPAVRNGARVGSIKVIEVPFEPDCTLTGSCPK